MVDIGGVLVRAEDVTLVRGDGEGVTVLLRCGIWEKGARHYNDVVKDLLVVSGS